MEKCITRKDVEKELWFMRMVEYMKESGKTIRDLEEASNKSLMGVDTKAISLIINQRDKAPLYGLMEIYMMVNF